MARTVLAALLLVALVAPLPPAQASETDETVPPPLVLFWGDGCPHCEAEWEFLGGLSARYQRYRWAGTDSQASWYATSPMGLDASLVPLR